MWKDSGVNFETTVAKNVACALDMSVAVAVIMHVLSYSISVEKMKSASLNEERHESDAVIAALRS